MYFRFPTHQKVSGALELQCYLSMFGREGVGFGHMCRGLDASASFCAYTAVRGAIVMAVMAQLDLPPTTRVGRRKRGHPWG